MRKYKIKDFIQTTGITTKEVAEACGCTVQTIHNYLAIDANSRTSAKADHLRTMARLFGCEMEDLYTDSSPVYLFQHNDDSRGYLIGRYPGISIPGFHFLEKFRDRNTAVRVLDNYLFTVVNQDAE